jgi:aspartate/methionine/tyrosine aminotransferase
VAAWGDEAHVKRTRERYRRKRELLLPVLAGKGLEVVASTATMYLWVAIDEPEEELVGRLLERGIVVSPGTFFGPSGAGYVRFALVPTLEECGRAAAILEEVL